MPLASNLIRRGAIYHFRVTIPSDLQERFGRREIWRSLKTTNGQTAKRRRLDAQRAADRLFRAVRGKRGMDLDRDKIEELVRSLFVVEMDYVDHEPAVAVEYLPDDMSVKEKARKHREFLEEAKQDYLDMLAADDFRRMVCDVDGLLHFEDIPPESIDHECEEFHDLCRAVARGHLAAVKARLARVTEGDFDYMPSDPLLAQCNEKPLRSSLTQSPDSTAIRAERPMTVLIKAFLDEERASGIKEKSVGEKATALNWLVDCYGEVKNVGSFSKSDVVEFKDVIGNLWPKWSTRPQTRDLPIRVAAAWCAGNTDERQKRDILNAKRLKPIEQFFDWAAKNAYVPEDFNPARGVSFTVSSRERKTRKRDAFTTDQLNRIFSSVAFTGCRSQSRWKEPGDHSFKAYRRSGHNFRFWAVLLALFSGARRGEFAVLTVDDIFQDEDVWCIRVSDIDDADTGESDGRSLKNDQSRRVVPLHPQIIAMGFLEYVAAVRADGQKRLFSNSAEAMGKWMRNLLDAVGITSKRVSPLHGFRHSFEEAAFRSIRDEALRSALTGREDPSSARAYRTPRAPELFEAIKTIEYPGLDLSHLI
ncbi:site-specific integrase [Magnetospira sp. QH-2]|uniref:site-specific integrase n=1 Tax=Magnetospira sp. (strain QH-2) TaxID=1288970 RepID=UPI0003E81A91|nr:site-specific integrase [Magnetospira sp. QH-2]CCQ72413.1 Putative phage integrase [Magnetospira sp. QH-2]